MVLTIVGLSTSRVREGFPKIYGYRHALAFCPALKFRKSSLFHAL
jgi:hypothetical protein